MTTYTFKVPAFSIPYSDKYLSDTLRLNEFQEDVYNLLSKGRDILLVAPTGSGKTLTLLLNDKHGMRFREGRELYGFVALYPNNTLLRNQMCTVEDIIVEHMGASIVEDMQGLYEDSICTEGGARRRCYCITKEDTERVEPITVYQVSSERTGDRWVGCKYVALMALSGRYVISEEGIPKRELLYSMAERILSYARRGGLYLIVFATPDTYLLVSTGAYRDFEGVGKSVHNILLAIAEGMQKSELEKVLRETGVLTRATVEEIVAVSQRLLALPLFIDEFHLYGSYELDALHAILKLYKELNNYPVVFSSATPPSEDVFRDLNSDLRPERVEAEIIEGTSGFPVRGDTEIVVITVETTRRHGLPAFYEAAQSVPKVVLSQLLNVLGNIGDGRALIILDRLWMVSYLAGELARRGLEVECIASITPPGLCRPGSKVIVASEAATQGVNLGKVVLGITAGTSSEDVIHRIGRVGRRGVNSRIYLIVPEHAAKRPPPTMSYSDMVKWIASVYPDYPKRERDVSKLIPRELHEIRRKLIYSLGVASLARVSGVTNLLSKIDLSKEEAVMLLDHVIGDPLSLVNLLVFRRNGFNVKYVVEGSDKRGETSIGILARNFEIKDLLDSLVVITLKPKRQEVSIKAHINPSAFKGKIVDLKMFLKALKGRIYIDDRIALDEGRVGGVLAYVVDAGEELSEYLSYTGEGAMILTRSGGRFAVIFI